MKLTLSVEGRKLASVDLDASKAENDYYVKAFRRLLIIRHKKTLAALKKEPLFSIEIPVENRRSRYVS